MNDRESLLRAAIPELIGWYRENGRALPWRQGSDPYRIWVSEIMLQQTRIEAVIPYYARFLARLPDVAALAAADDGELMKLWEGLGYYSRARNLKRAAQIIVQRGGFPHTPTELKALPGIGEYTAGAIASIAFGEPAPAVDGNVLRLLARLFADPADIAAPPAKKAARELLAAVYPAGEDASLLTQALMELGETVCLPNGTPLCAACPLRGRCAAAARHRQAEFPMRAKKKSRRREKWTVLLYRDGAHIGLIRRPEKGLLAGLWGLPMMEGHLSAPALAQLTGADRSAIRPLGKAEHIFTHVEWDMVGYELSAPIPASLCPVTKEAMEREYCVPAAFRAFLQE